MSPTDISTVRFVSGTTPTRRTKGWLKLLYSPRKPRPIRHFDTDISTDKIDTKGDTQ